MEVIGSSYPLPKSKSRLMLMVRALQVLVVAVIMCSDKIVSGLGITELPSWYSMLSKGKMNVVMFAVTIGNMAAKFMGGSGAFEVFYDGKLVFSKLQQGSLPEEADIIAKLDALGAPRKKDD